MAPLLFECPPRLTLPIKDQEVRYPVNRIFCVGRNFAAHAAEMGVSVERDKPFYFTKSVAHAILTGASVEFPIGTTNYHHEVELVAAIGKPLHRASCEESRVAIFGYGCGLDMTRRDLQIEFRKKQLPWDLGKDVENSAVFSALVAKEDFDDIAEQRIWLTVNGELKQDAKLNHLIWTIDELVSDLSHYYHLRPGDLLMSGTPAGVGPVQPGDTIVGGVDGLACVELTFN